MAPPHTSGADPSRAASTHAHAPHEHGLADLHLHTLASDGLMSVQALLDYAERSTRLDVVAITDHDETQAALEGREYVARKGYRVQVIPAVEVTTSEGHLIA